ncbi:MAG TPA: type II toxin-antitoxin system VapC family toxin [Pyrinomonadaceae bacterium]|nr:type II toxin-antitoxin system VapC family toxin [Pyrinomonadaceae bacterium]
MKAKVYIETTIVSYLTAHTSRDLVVAAHQQITQEWWTNRRSDFELYASQLVIQESSAGDEQMAQLRLAALDETLLLDVNQDAVKLARSLIQKGPIPEKAAVDALHIAIAAVHGMDYLLTWNCRHIANAEMQTAVAAISRANGYEPPVICTPEELLGG